jgi:hypothetical protein
MDAMYSSETPGLLQISGFATQNTNSEQLQDSLANPEGDFIRMKQ